MFGVRLLVVVLFIGIINISQSIEFKNIFGSWFSSNSAPKGRLLTPEEGCGLTKVTNTKIIGGSFAKPGAWPWIAALGYYSPIGESFECGGSLITSRHVLTAGHCVRGIGFVRLGAHNIRAKIAQTYIDVKVICSRRLPKYKEGTETDMAILYLERDVEFTDRIRPICLPTNEPIRSQSFIGTTPFVAGWGKTSERVHGSRTDILKQAQMPVLDNKMCEKLYRKAKYESDFPESVICAGNLGGGEDACAGDSGGPLMLPIQKNGTFPFYQIGVIAFGMICGDKSSPGGYVSTQYYIDWIQEMIKFDVGLH